MAKSNRVAQTHRQAYELAQWIDKNRSLIQQWKYSLHEASRLAGADLKRDVTTSHLKLASKMIDYEWPVAEGMRRSGRNSIAENVAIGSRRACVLQELIVSHVALLKELGHPIPPLMLKAFQNMDLLGRPTWIPGTDEST